MVKLTKSRLKSLKARFAKLIKEGQAKVTDIQEIDFEAYWDSSLTYEESVNSLLRRFAIPEVREEEYKIVKAEHLEDISKKYEKKFHEEVAKIKGGEQDNYFSKLRDYIIMVTRGYANSLIIESIGGLGKTHNVLQVLAEEKADYEYVNSYSTPLEFYQLLFKNSKENKILVLDDVEGILSSNVGISILKSALWSVTDKRIVSYHTTSNRLEVPNNFEYAGRIIVCLNSIRNNPELQALKTRTLFFKLDFGLEEIKKVIMAIAKSAEKYLSEPERIEVADYLINNVDESVDDFNIRTLLKSFMLYKYAKEVKKDWQELLKGLLNINEEKKLVKELIGLYPTDTKLQVRQFCEKIGKSRATFYRLKKEMKLTRAYSV